ncbi:PAS domain S-box-containing protein [Roseibium denhamense]|uniref:histidine kinase n=2 Tax=Roseibium denhamense TaxID=76305 RepID=A0ABY1NIW9_9HYPH|nr:PAS domain S-box-containing protein [Roseibium denhamense]
MRQRIVSMIQDATFWLVLVFICASAISAYVIAVDFGQKARTADLSAAAQAQNELLTATRSFYSREVIDKVYLSDDMSVSHDYHGKDLTIPAPVSMTLGLEEELAALGASSRIRMLSNHPWPWRQDRELDSFEREALAALSEAPDQPYQRLEARADGNVFRSARAVRMEDSCVACHNSHPESPKTDWEVGDIRGIQEVILPASALYGGGVTSIDSLIVLLGVAFLAAVALTLVLSSQRQRALTRVHDLADAEREKNAALQAAITRAETGEAQVNAVLETMLDGVVTLSPGGDLLSANPSALRMFGVASFDDLSGKRICDILPEDDANVLPFECCAGPSPELDDDKARFEVTGRRFDGSRYPVELSLSKTVVDGRVTYTAILRDLTEQKAAAAKLLQAETRLVDAIESLPDGFVLYDADDRLVMCNSKYKEFYRRSADLIEVGKTFEEIIRDGAQRGQYQVSGEALEDWVELRMQNHRHPGAPMEQHLDDGRWLRVIESRTSEGGLVGFRVDITELKKREQELVRSQSLLRNVVSASFDGVIVMDGNGTVLDYSPSAEEVFGWKAAEIVGEKMSDYIIPEKYRAMHDAGLEKFLKTGEGPVLGKRIEIEGLHKEGHQIIVELAIRHTKGERGPLFLGYVRDITERKAAEEALRDAKEKAEAANEAKAKFLAMMSHEIRTPMNGVLGILSLLRDTDLDPDQKSYVKTARDSGRSLLELINDILDFSKLEAGRTELETAPFRLKTVVRSIVDLFMPIAQEKGIGMELIYPADVPQVVTSDAGRLRQVLLNLVSNAVKFTELGSIRITVSVDKDDPVRPVFRFSVQDTGIGIPKDRHESLFGDFVTIDSSYTKKQGGTGLGLAISKRISDLMGGEILVESLPGAGSTFHFCVPLELADEQAELPEPEVAMLEEHIPDGLTVLVAEDNATNQIVVSHALQRAGCDIDIANNGKEAVIAAQNRDYDCILMDISMPEMDGLEATRHIQNGHRNTNTPVIALTAYALRGDRERFLAAGMADFLSKPVEKQDLLACIARNVRRHASAFDHAITPATHQELSEARVLLADMPPALQEKLLNQFKADTREKREAARLAAQTHDFTQLERATHALKSVAGTFGATRLTTIAAEINTLVREEKTASALTRVDELISISDDTLADVKALADEMEIGLAPDP